MKIVGVGVGPGMLTSQAIETIRHAEILYGSPRAIQLAQEHIRCEAKTIGNYSRIHELPSHAVVLSTGDPNLSGLGKYAGCDDEIVPGISSLQAACARLRMDMAGVVVVSAHGRTSGPAAAEIKQAAGSGYTVFVLPSPEVDVTMVASILLGIGLEVPLAVLERLGYPDERVDIGYTGRPPRAYSPLYCIMAGPAVPTKNLL